MTRWLVTILCACLASCGGAEADTSCAGATVVVAAQDSPSSLTVGGTMLYWIAGGSAVMQVATGGGDAKSLVNDQPSAQCLTVDADNVYWTSTGAVETGMDYSHGTLTSIARSGGAPHVLASMLSLPFGLVTSSTDVYWTNRGAPMAPGSGSIMSAAIGGGPSKVLVSGRGTPNRITVDALHLFWTTFEGEILMLSFASGSVPVQMAHSQPAPDRIVVDATTIYWANTGGDSGSIMSIPIAGGTLLPLAAGQARVTGLAVDSRSVYWTSVVDGAQSAVRMVPKTGGSVVALACGLDQPQDLTTAGGELFWGDSSAQTVVKLSVPVP